MTRKAKRTNHCIKKKKRRNREEGVSLDAREKCRNKVMTEKRCLDSFLFLFPPLFFFFSRYNREAEADQGSVVAVSARKKKKKRKESATQQSHTEAIHCDQYQEEEEHRFLGLYYSVAVCVCVCFTVVELPDARRASNSGIPTKTAARKKSSTEKKKTHTYIHI